MAKHIRTVETPWYSCDHCGYVIDGWKSEEDIGRYHIVLTVRGKTYHFHGDDQARGGREDVPPWDEIRSCFARWLLANRHLEAGDWAYTVTQVGKKPNDD